MEYRIAELEEYISSGALQKRIAELGAQISCDYAGQDLVLIAVLKGSVIFLSDLMRHITVPHSVDFMATSSYGNSTESSGIVRIVKDLSMSITGRNVLIVEDIIDTGHTLHYLLQILSARQPTRIRIVTLLDKKERREVDIQVDYVGFEIPNAFVVGYGLDFNEYYRNLSAIYIPKEGFF